MSAFSQVCNKHEYIILSNLHFYEFVPTHYTRHLHCDKMVMGDGVYLPLQFSHSYLVFRSILATHAHRVLLLLQFTLLSSAKRGRRLGVSVTSYFFKVQRGRW